VVERAKEEVAENPGVDVLSETPFGFSFLHSELDNPHVAPEDPVGLGCVKSGAKLYLDDEKAEKVAVGEIQ
jgi:hypothetical protein